MDPRIASLKSTTFCGRRLTRRQIADVQETVALSRNELAKTVCEHLNWTTPKGGYRVAACMRMLESLEEYGVLTLPAKRNTTPGPRTPITCTGRSDPRPEINCALAELEPLSLQSATEERDIADWNELVDRHHGLGCPRPFGPHLRWFVMDRDGRCLGCLLFEAAAKSLPARDAWIGWSEKDRDRRLHLAVSNSRFLILPWVRVDNLASRALSMAARHLSGEWQERHGCRPVLCETFVDPRERWALRAPRVLERVLHESKGGLRAAPHELDLHPDTHRVYFERRGAFGDARGPPGCGAPASPMIPQQKDNLDPQLQNHAVLAKMVKGGDGKWRSMANEGLYASRRALPQHHATLGSGCLARLYQTGVAPAGLRCKVSAPSSPPFLCFPLARAWPGATRLVSGWRAAPLPGGSRTCWTATRGFSSRHPPLQSLAWRNKRSGPGGSRCANKLFVMPWGTLSTWWQAHCGPISIWRGSTG